MAPERLNAEQIEERLEQAVDAVLSSRRTAAAPARALADFERPLQDLVLHWVDALAKTNSEMAYQLAACAPEALRHLDTEGLEAWAIQAMDAFDRKGLSAGISAMRQVSTFAHHRRARVTGLPLEKVTGILEVFIHGLHGRSLRVEASEAPYTDTETLFLPPLIGHFGSRAENFRLYKALAVHLWAQTWYGTWRIDLSERAARFPDRERAWRVYHALETLRLDGCLRRDLPGVARDMGRLHELLDPAGGDDEWAEAGTHLAQPRTGPEDSWDLVAPLYATPLPPLRCYQGILRPAEAQAIIAARLERERTVLRTGLAQLRDDILRREAPAAHPPPSFRVHDQGNREDLVLEFGDQLISPPEGLHATLQSVIQDLGQIPEEYLVPAGPGGGYAPRPGPEEQDPDAVWKGTYHEKGAHLYNEWDHVRRHYRKNWCVLRERDVHPQYDDFVSATLHKYGGLVKSLHRTFEALRGEEKVLKRQPFGEDVDIDAVVEAHADARSGMEMSERLFTKVFRVERDIAVMFMVDMSGSTKGWINDAEREALVLLCEALETLGDRYAIYGFSGFTRKRCELYRIKRFDEAYDDLVRARLSGIRPQDYTRMGVAIRHLSHLLNQIEARTKLLVTLSDGKPDDYTDYRGDYGIEDTRQALLEARRDGIHPFCITIDETGADYLPHMYGAANYVVLSDVRRLPLKVSDIYRRLTTR